MVKTTYEIDDNLDQRFRQAVATRKGFRKGALGEAVSEALEVWLDPETEKILEKYRAKAQRGAGKQQSSRRKKDGQ